MLKFREYFGKQIHFCELSPNYVKFLFNIRMTQQKLSDIDFPPSQL